MAEPRAPDGAYVAILAGGEGTRLWPLSRGHRPKQLLSLVSQRSLIQQTVDRVLPLVPAERILVITERSHSEDLHAQLPEIPRENIVVEATRRNTAAALLLGALHIQSRAPGATWASLHADAFILDDDEFRRTLSAALEAASGGAYLVTTGLRPQYPATGYGYIHQAEHLRDVQGYPLHRVERFVEKPDLETARRYVQSGEYLWNPGVFVWRNDAILAAFRTLQPEIYQVLTSVPLERIEEVYPSAPKETIDNGILENAPNVATLPATFRWSDIGSWSELWDVLAKDEAGNASAGPGRHLAVDTTGTLVYSASRTVATVGVEDLVVVETPDVVFVCDRGRTQDVKLIVKRLQSDGALELL
ncbi:MAG: mannose-1-phosphate guanylyltransferase [Chloroflexi bacterium]|nr:mannose-1-phosphate guanylyltransferase [Chloroflexota bacterium]